MFIYKYSNLLVGIEVGKDIGRVDGDDVGVHVGSAVGRREGNTDGHAVGSVGCKDLQ